MYKLEKNVGFSKKFYYLKKIKERIENFILIIFGKE